MQLSCFELVSVWLRNVARLGILFCHFLVGTRGNVPNFGTHSKWAVKKFNLEHTSLRKFLALVGRFQNRRNCRRSIRFVCSPSFFPATKEYEIVFSIKTTKSRGRAVVFLEKKQGRKWMFAVKYYWNISRSTLAVCDYFMGVLHIFCSMHLLIRIYR